MAYFSTSVDAELVNYLEDAYEDLAYREHVLMGSCNKKSEFGDAVKVPIKIAYSAGQGGNFTNAAANDNGTQRVPFLVQPAKVYGVEGVDNSQLIFTTGGEQAVISILTDAIKSSTEACGDQCEIACFGDGYGTLGTILSNSGGGPYVLTLSNVNDTYKFSNGMVLVSKATPASASLDTGTITVSSLDQIAGTITVAALGGWTPTNAHVLGLQGTMLASTAPSTFVGLQGFIPKATARPSGGENFLGIDRTQNAVLLAGHYLDGRKRQILDGINTLAGSIANVSGARPDVVFANPAVYAKIQAVVDAKASSTMKGGDIDVYYDSVTLQGPKGKMNVVPATFCPMDQVFVCDSRTLFIGSPDNKPIRPASPKGDFVDLSTADTSQVRMRGAFFFYVTAPGFNGNLLVA